MNTFPITQTQLGIYLADTAALDNAAYNIDMLYHLDADIDIDRLKSALESVVNNHPYVKSRLVQNDEGELRMEDHSNDAPLVEEREVESIDVVSGEIGRKYDLLSEPLYRLVIYKTPLESLLYVDFHHIIFDGMSFSNFRKELSQAYVGETLALEGKDGFTVALEEEDLRNTEAYTEAKDWYAQEFGAASEVDSMPRFDATNKEDGQWMIAFHPLKAKEAEVKAVCEEYGASVSIPFTAAFGYTLATYSAAEEALYTTIFHGRSDKLTRNAFTMMVKTIPVYQNFSKTPTVRELLRQTQEQMAGTRKRTVYSFGELHRDLGIEPHVCFAYQGTLHTLNVTLDGREQAGDDLRPHRPGIDFMVHVIQKDENFECKVEYNTAMYTADFVERFCATYSKILDEMMSKNELADFELLNDKEISLQQSFYHKADTSDFANETVVTLFRSQAAATPDALAIVFDDPMTGEHRSYTYAEVDQITERMAQNLASIGVCPEQPVGVMIDRSEKIVLFPLAIMKAGGAYMPLDSHFPEDRLTFMCEDASVKIILTEGNLLKDAMPSFAGKVLTFEELNTSAFAADNVQLTGPAPENMHVILYTSGSTGKPKGVVLEQHNMVNFCKWFTSYYNVTAADRVAAFANFGFDVHQADLWPILTVGGSIYVIPQSMRLDLAGLEEYINKNQLTLANITTQIGSMFAASVKKSTLRALIVAGEKLGPTEKPEYGFYNAYGPTECTIYATCYDIVRDYDSSLIGLPLMNYNVAVVNSRLKPVPVGAPGELLILGEGVGRGYLNRPDVTAEKFITYNGDKAYRTGDQVCMMADGQIDYIGRMDGQVKLRGLRIELGEVEAAILRHPAVKAAAAAVKEIAGTQHLCAYYALKDGETATADEVRDFMSQSVTDFMVPDFMTQLNKLPYNANGKVDRKQLPVPEVSDAEGNGNNENASHVWNKLQTKIRDIVSSMTGVDNIGINSELRYYGLTSLLAMKLAVQFNKKLGIRLPARDLPAYTIFEIEDYMLDNMMNNDNVALSNDNSHPDEKSSSLSTSSSLLSSAPITFPQQGVYMDCQMNPDTTMYNIPKMLTFPKSVATEALADAVRNVAQGHTSLFCNFYQTAEGVMMRKAENTTLDVVVKTLDDEEFKAEKASFVRPFNLEHDRLIRAEIIVLKDGSKALLLDMHHMVSDGSSLDLFCNQIIDTLNGNSIEAETYDYLHFAIDQKAKADAGLDADKVFYDEMFALYEAAANVPSDKMSAEEGVSRHISTPIPTHLLGNSPFGASVSAAHFWFAAFNYALSRFANTKDVYTAFISGGRQNVDIADTMGMFVNTVPCAVHIKDQTVKEFVEEVSKSFSDVLVHENYPFARIASDYDFKGSASYAYQIGVVSDYMVNGEKVNSELLTLNKPKIPLSIFIQNVNGVPSVDAEYDDSKYSSDLILRFTESIVAVAEYFVEDMTAKVKNVSIMSERQRLEVEAMHSVNEDMTFPIRTFHEGIEQWAVKTPDALALMACDRDMTYREYNAEANQMARALMARGMKYGDRVVLLLPRRSYYLTALFAVMKCGGAFIPMDPEYPADRIAYILDDSEGRFVITTPEKVADYPDRAIDIFQLLEEAKAQPSENLDVKVDPHDLAYLIYTSGSTGRPKGVMIEHLGAASFLTFYKSDTNFGADSNANRVGLCQSTVSFDLSVGEIGVQVFNGDTVAFANEDEMMSPVEMIKLCRRTGAQTISGTPSRLAVNLELGEYYDLIKDQMKCVVTGGEKLPGALLDELEKMNVYIINTYGPTETTMGSSAGVLNGTREVHVGKPFTNYTYQVLDSDRNELPVGVMGELCIGGIGLARGYNNMPERTAETFIQWHGKRIYRTGDYAMWTKDGNIIIMGRTDNQVKLNGLRIELGEIETVMSQQPGMRQCVAIIKKLGNIDKLIGYYTVDETVANIPVADYEEQVRADMSVKLTPYMVPGIFVRLDEMPLTPVGKTDVKRLPMPNLQTGEYVAPKNDVEKTFCEIFAKILNLKRISATDNFFELGGTSLVAMQLIGEASKVGYNIVYKSIFDNATPHLLARMLKPELYQGEDTKKKLPMADEIEAYDYAQLDDILAANTIDNFRASKCYDQMGNVLLAGATGFLGIHVLHNLIERNDVPYIYCLVRSNKVLSAKSRLRTQLFYYFDNAYDELFENGRITVIEGDVTNAEVFEQFNQPLDVVINCAANVKHFSAGTDIEDINIKGCQNCIDLCLRTRARFIQTSTGSIAGNSVGDTAASPIIFTERDLYHNQELTTKYAASKFLAERNVLDAMKNHGLKGKIMRLGNLSARSTDGEFQINFRSNNAMATLKAFQVLGCIPYEREFGYSEFSPINEVADAIVRLSMTPDSCTVFQPGNVHWPPYGDIIECMNRIGIPIERVEQEEFQKRLTEAMNDAEKSDLVQSLVAYREASDGRVHVMNGWDTKAYTGQILLRLGFRWSFTTWDYVERYLQCLQGLGVFDSDFKR